MSQILSPIATVSESSDCLYPSVQHLVTMLDDDGNEIVLRVWTETNSFCDVLRECKRVIAVAWLDEGLDYRGYRFYESFEVVDRVAAKVNVEPERQRARSSRSALAETVPACQHR